MQLYASLPRSGGSGLFASSLAKVVRLVLKAVNWTDHSEPPQDCSPYFINFLMIICYLQQHATRPVSIILP